ncbi:MAG: hypothetical protein LQ341_004624 [Variospora aurantia]|nr:MAG: hypothetical protein LQ341_004624 [Variospora aurantia]
MASAKGRRNVHPLGSKKTVVSSLEVDVAFPAPDAQNGIDWTTIGASTLNAYRQMRRLQIPPAFGSPFNQRVLCRSVMGKRSPTMARHAGQRRISQERSALAIKKDFNDAMVNELESITNFLYSVRHHDKSFRIHFKP